MPPKGWKSGRDETMLKTVRLPESIMERVVQHVERLQSQFRFARITESMALRDLIERGLDAAESQAIPGGQLLLPIETETHLANAIQAAETIVRTAQQLEAMEPAQQPEPPKQRARTRQRNQAQPEPKGDRQ